MRAVDARRTAPTPLCPAGHLPLKGGDQPGGIGFALSASTACRQAADAGSSQSPPLRGRCPAGQRGVAVQLTSDAWPKSHMPSAQPPQCAKDAQGADRCRTEALERAARAPPDGSALSPPDADRRLHRRFRLPAPEADRRGRRLAACRATPRPPPTATRRVCEALGWTILRFWNDDVLARYRQCLPAHRHRRRPGRHGRRSPGSGIAAMRPTRELIHDRPYRHLRFRLRQSKAFYDAAFAPLGATLLMTVPAEYTGGVEGRRLWPRASRISGCTAAGRDRARHATIAFTARSRAEVDAFHAAAIAAGGRDNGAPGLRAALPSRTTTAPSSSIPTATMSRRSATRPNRRSLA